MASQADRAWSYSNPVQLVFGENAFASLSEKTGGLAKDPVVLGVRNFRRVEHIVKVLVMLQFLAQIFDFLGNGTHGDVILEKSLNISSRS